MVAISAATDPEAATAAAAAAISKADDPGALPTAPLPANTIVTLPGGYLNLSAGKVSTDAEVRELTGEDEEAIGRVAGNVAKYLDTILARGVVEVGGVPTTKAILDGLLLGDREALLLGIRRVTFGDEVTFNVTCPECRAQQDAVVNLVADIPVDKLDNPVADRRFTLDLPSGKKAAVTLPDGEAQRALHSVEDPNEGTLKTVLLAHCVAEIDGMPIVGESAVRALSIRDRREIIKEINQRAPGPRLGEVTRPCEACGENMPLPLSLVDLFLL